MTYTTLTLMKTVVLALVFVTAVHAVVAQAEDDRRTGATRISELLSEIPASNGAEWEKHIAVISKLGEASLTDMISTLSGYGKKDNTQLEYVLGGLSYYVSQLSSDQLRELAVGSYIKALEHVQRSEERAFIIRQLAIIGAPEAVPHIAKYCGDEQLCGAVARAMVSIGSPEASAALLMSLDESQGTCREAIIAALGDLQYKPAVKALTSLAGSTDQNLEKIVLYSLSNIGDPSSLDVLMAAARKANYQYDVTNATASLIQYARCLMESGNQKMTLKIAKELLEREEVDPKIAGLNLIVALKGQKSFPWLLKAAESASPEYRSVALNHAVEWRDKKYVKRWVRRVNVGQIRDRAAVVAMLGQMKTEAALPTIYELLNDDDQTIRLASIDAAWRIAGVDAIPLLLKRMNIGTDDDMTAVKAILLQMHFDTLESRVRPVLSSIPPNAKAALIDVLREKTSRHNYVGNQDRTFKPFVLSDKEVAEGFRILFDGTDLDEWMGNTDGYIIKEGTILLDPERGCCNLYTKDQFSDFEFRFEFRLSPGGNNGVGIRTPPHGDAAYVGMEIQILDNGADIYKDLREYQYHGSVYGIIPAKRGFLKPVGEWNYQQIIAKGSRIKVILNGEVIVDGDVIEASKNGTLDGRPHPGIQNTTGHIAFLYHSTPIQFRDIRIKEL